MSLRDYGWCDYFSQAFENCSRPDWAPGRITLVHRDLFVVAGEQGDAYARVCGRFRQAEATSEPYPVIGDWVAWAGANGGTVLIQAVLPRKSLLARKKPGNRIEQQAIAANVDTAFLVMGLDLNFNLRRMERMLTMTYESGAVPVIVLTKLDLAPEAEAQVISVESIAPGVPILSVSSLSGEGLDLFGPFLSGDSTVVFLGSSGVGKSTLINRLFGSEMARTAEIRASDGRGRHTTTHRQLFRHPGGALLIDNPGSVSFSYGAPRTPCRLALKTSKASPPTAAIATARTQTSRNARFSQRFETGRSQLNGLKASTNSAGNCATWRSSRTRVRSAPRSRDGKRSTKRPDTIPRAEPIADFSIAECGMRSAE